MKNIGHHFYTEKGQMSACIKEKIIDAVWNLTDMVGEKQMKNLSLLFFAYGNIGREIIVKTRDDVCEII